MSAWLQFGTTPPPVECRYLWITDKLESVESVLGSPLLDANPNDIINSVMAGKAPDWMKPSTAVSVYKLERHGLTEHVECQVYCLPRAVDKPVAGGLECTENIESWRSSETMVYLRHNDKTAVCTFPDSSLYATYFVPEMTFLFCKIVSYDYSDKSLQISYPRSFFFAGEDLSPIDDQRSLFRYSPKFDLAPSDIMSRLSNFTETATLHLNSDGMPRAIFWPNEDDPSSFFTVVKQYDNPGDFSYPVRGVYGAKTREGAHASILLVQKDTLKIRNTPVASPDIKLIPLDYKVHDAKNNNAMPGFKR